MGRKSFFIAGIFLACLTASMPLYAQDVKESEQLDFAQGLLSRGMYGMAISEYQKFITDYPHSPSLPEAYLSLGEGYFLSQDFNKAVDVFNQFKQLFPHSDQLPVSVLRLGQIDIQQGKYDEALKELTAVEAQDQLKGPMLQTYDFYEAQAYAGQGDMASALNFFQKAVAVSGASDYTAYAYEEIGKIEAADGHYSDALDAFAKSMAQATDASLKGELAYRTAEVQFLSAHYDEAIKGFADVIEQYPGLGFIQDALANMLLAYFNLGEYDPLLKAYEHYAPQIKNDDSYFATHDAAVMAYIELKEFDQANKLLDRMLAFPNLKPQERAKIFIKKSDILIRQERYKDALALLDAYSSQDADGADETFFLKAQCYYGLADYDRAFNFFENVYLNYPGSRFYKAALLGQAHARKEAGRFKEAEVLFLKYNDLEADPALKSDALYDALIMAVKAGDQAPTVVLARQYLKTFPHSEKYADVLLLLADSDGKNNQPQEAVDLLKGYLAANPVVEQPNAVNFLLGYNEGMLGHNDAAMAAYAKVDPKIQDGKFYAQALKNMAIIALSAKDFNQARTYFDRLIGLSGPNDLQLKTYIWVCNEYLKEKQYDEVLNVVAQARKHFQDKDLLDIGYFQAEALRGLGRCEEAVKYYGPLEDSTPKDVYTGSAHIGHGMCMEVDQKFEEAKGEFQKALDENPDDYTITAHARFEMANTEASEGHFDEALKFYLLVATIYDDGYFCSQALLKAAQISERLQRKADALKMYDEILEKYKNSDAAQYATERVGLLK